uniref:Uncharacterized protein n=1 Tax=Avena sativa TaxID=4498 RepID=A0ACD5XAP9_AVESA
MVEQVNAASVVGFYNPHYTLKALGGEHHDLPRPRNATKEKTLKFAHELFDKGCKDVEERNFSKASECFSHALKIRVLHYGKLAPQCASTFYRYGCALLCKALAANNLSGCVSKCALNEESVKITAATSKDDVESSSASGSNVEHVPLSGRSDYEEGENLNRKDQEDVNVTCDEAKSDLDLAWKMLDIARAIVVKSPEKTMAKVNISYALAEVSMKRGDRYTAISYYMGALAILEHFCRPDDRRVVQRNIHICAKAISACQSLIQNLENASVSG